MDYSSRKVDLARIRLEDETFRLSTNAPRDKLAGSIARVGLINPPVLLTHENQYTIVCGFSRIQACRQLEWTQLPARCLEANTPRRQCALLTVAEAVSHRSLNIVEQARAMDLLIRFFTTPQEAIEAADAVGFAMNPRLAEKLSAVKAFGSQLQRGMIEESIGFSVALRIHAKFDDADAEALSALFRQMQMSLTRQRETLDWIETIIHREGITLNALLSDPHLVQWRRNEDLDNPQRSRIIREYLKQRCCPTISAFQEHFNQRLKKIRMGKGIRFSPPPHFEGRSFSLGIEFSTYEECLQRIKDTQQLVQSAAFRDLLEPRFKPD